MCAFHLTAAEVAAIYKARWQIELFFKWVKQHLKLKSFLGTTANAVMTQVWVALCVYLLVAYVKFLLRPPGACTRFSSGYRSRRWSIGLWARCWPGRRKTGRNGHQSGDSGTCSEDG